MLRRGEDGLVDCSIGSAVKRETPAKGTRYQRRFWVLDCRGTDTQFRTGARSERARNR